MRTCMIGVLALLAALAAFAQTVSPTASLQILSPKPGEGVSNDFVSVQYELASPTSASSTPTFVLRLDNSEPVQTTDTQYTFTGLTPGTHTVSIEVVDANGTPLPGVRGQIQFTIQPAPPPAPGR